MNDLRDKIKSGKKISFLEIVLGKAENTPFPEPLSLSPAERVASKELYNDIVKKRETLDKIIKLCSENYPINELLPNLFKLIRLVSDFDSTQDNTVYLSGHFVTEEENHKYPNSYIGIYKDLPSFDLSFSNSIIIPFKKLIIGVPKDESIFSKHSWERIDKDKLGISPEEFSGPCFYDAGIVFGKEQIKSYLKDDYPIEVEGWQ